MSFVAVDTAVQFVLVLFDGRPCPLRIFGILTPQCSSASVASSSLRQVLVARYSTVSTSDSGAQDRTEVRLRFSFFPVWIRICCDGSRWTGNKDTFEDLKMMVVREQYINTCSMDLAVFLKERGLLRYWGSGRNR